MQYGYGKGWPEGLVLNIVLCSPEEWKQLKDKDYDEFHQYLYNNYRNKEYFRSR